MRVGGEAGIAQWSGTEVSHVGTWDLIPSIAWSHELGVAGNSP